MEGNNDILAIHNGCSRTLGTCAVSLLALSLIMFHLLKDPALVKCLTKVLPHLFSPRRLEY